MRIMHKLTLHNISHDEFSHVVYSARRHARLCMLCLRLPVSDLLVVTISLFWKLDIFRDSTIFYELRAYVTADDLEQYLNSICKRQ